MSTEPIMRVFCACSAYPEQPGSVVCWKCEQPLAEIDPDDLEGGLVQNLLLLCNRYRAALQEITSRAGTDAFAFANEAYDIAEKAIDLPAREDKARRAM